MNTHYTLELVCTLELRRRLGIKWETYCLCGHCGDINLFTQSCCLKSLERKLALNVGKVMVIVMVRL